MAGRHLTLAAKPFVFPRGWTFTNLSLAPKSCLYFLHQLLPRFLPALLYSIQRYEKYVLLLRFFFFSFLMSAKLRERNRKTCLQPRRVVPSREGRTYVYMKLELIIRRPRTFTSRGLENFTEQLLIYNASHTPAELEPLVKNNSSGGRSFHASQRA